MNETMFSLWWMPNPDTEAFKSTQGVINDLSEKYQTPLFDTHITLIADRKGSAEEIIAQTQQLAEKITPFEVTLGKTRATNNLYQSFVAIAQGEELEEAAYIAREQWKDHQGTVYRPHLSLIYTENTDSEFKKQLITEVGQPFQGQTFIADRIHVFTSIPGIEGISKWERIAEIPLKGSNV